ncbi:S26 family signal peptidase [Streptomyces chattanoogensis]|uniref:S26 family signal peptidase n=1 Tax=Streptomyces chattanoogensis TaxID=66876 RepID=UPI0036AD442D
MILLWCAIGAGTCLALLLAWLRMRVIRVEISGISMLPTFRPGDRVLARRVRQSRIATGDVVILASPPRTLAQLQTEVRPYEIVSWEPHTSADPARKGSWVVKRVAAVPGEPVPIPVRSRVQGTVVPQGSFVALGDNPADSVDSRHHGYLPLHTILGKVVSRHPRRARWASIGTK